MRSYVDVVVPEAIVANRVEEDEDRKLQERRDAVMAKDAAIVAAYEGLPAEMRDGFKAMLDYLALAERRGANGFRRGGPPIANMLLMTLRQAEAEGIPQADKGNDGDSFSFRW